MVAYRNSTQIVAELLMTAKDSGQEGVRKNTLIQKSNLSHGRLMNFLNNLTGSGLINEIKHDGKNTFVITEKGVMYLQEYQKFTSLAGSFGLEL